MNPTGIFTYYLGGINEPSAGPASVESVKRGRLGRSTIVRYCRRRNPRQRRCLLSGDRLWFSIRRTALGPPGAVSKVKAVRALGLISVCISPRESATVSLPCGAPRAGDPGLGTRGQGPGTARGPPRPLLRPVPSLDNYVAQ